MTGMQSVEIKASPKIKINFLDSLKKMLKSISLYGKNILLVKLGWVQMNNASMVSF
jgi:hypothetical protein